MTWTAAELARVQATGGSPAEARRTLADPLARVYGDPSSELALLFAQAVIALAEGDRETAMQRSVAAIEARAAGGANVLAGRVWWTARLFGDDAAGGSDAATRARELLEEHAWFQALREPDLVPAPTPAPS